MGRKSLFCEKCDPLDIIETSEGYVCGICGTVVQDQLLVKNHKPYDDSKCHDEPLNRNQMGTIREQITSPHSESIARQSKLNSILDRTQTVLQETKSEISRIFAYLNLPKQYESMVFKKYVKIRSILDNGNYYKKYKHPNFLIPFITQCVLRKYNVSVKERELLEIARIPRIKDAHSKVNDTPLISRKQINKFKLIVLQFFPHYEGKVKFINILLKIEEIREHFGLDDNFYYLSKRILSRLWNHVDNKSDKTIAAEIASIATLCFFEDRLSIHAICKKLGISASTPQKRIKEDVFDYYKYSGFTTLKKSAGLLKKILILENIVEDTEGLKPYYCKVLKWMTKIPDFYFFKNTEYYLFIFKKSIAEVVINSFRFSNIPCNAQKPYKNSVNDVLIFELDLSKYSVKDPPYLFTFY